MCAFVRILGREMEKWGGMRRKLGEGGEEGGVNEGRKGSRSGDEGGGGSEE